jgi:hypothetical protein
LALKPHLLLHAGLNRRFQGVPLSHFQGYQVLSLMVICRSVAAAIPPLQRVLPLLKRQAPCVDMAGGFHTIPFHKSPYVLSLRKLTPKGQEGG